MSTNALDLVPAFRRQTGVYINGQTTNNSALAGYIADAVQALMPKWDRDYAVTFVSPATYTISPNIEDKDIRPIILMSSIIYKMGNVGLFSFVDGDFSWSPVRGYNTVAMDKEELLTYVPTRLAKAVAGQFTGFKSIYNPESYDWLSAVDYIWTTP